MPPFRISRSVHAVTDGLLSHPRDCASYLILADAPVLIDCGSGEGHGALTRNLARLGVRPADLAAVICTHCHYDHVNGLAALRAQCPDIPLTMHRADAAAVETADPDLTCAGWMFHTRIESLRVDNKLIGGETIEIAGLALEAIHTPGHSPGSMCLRAEVDGRAFLFAGDCLTPSCSRVNGDRGQWEQTLDLCAGLEFDTLLPGHSSQLNNPYYAALMALRGRRARGAALRLMQSAQGPFWTAASFQYRYLISPFARITDMLKQG